MIRIRADCKLSAKPPLIGLKSDHRERSSVSSRARLSFVCICTGEKSWRECIEGEYAIGGKGGGDILHTEKLPQNELHHGVDRLPGNANSSLPLTLSFSLPRWCVLCLALGFCLYYSTALSRALLYPNIGEFVNSGSSWVNWPVREVISDFGEGEGEGEKWIGCFFFFISIRFFFFFYVQPEAWHLEFTTCRLHIIHICDIMRSRNLSRIQNSRGCFLSPSFFSNVPRFTVST